MAVKNNFPWVTLFVLFLFLAGGCAVTNPDPEPHGTPWTASELENVLAGDDPIEGFNRSMFACTDFVMNYFVDPLGRVYTSILPRPAIEKFDNLCVNLEFPARAFSCLARAEWEGAGDETMRFFINTTIGIAGLFDPAGAWFDIYSTDSDFGQTFAAWGIGPGCTFMLPLMSSVNVRDSVGSIFDIAFDLKTYIPFAGYATALNRMVVAHRAYTPVVQGSADPYKSYRELMVLRRELLLRQYFWHAKNAAAAARKAQEETPAVEAEPLPAEKQVQIAEDAPDAPEAQAMAEQIQIAAEEQEAQEAQNAEEMEIQITSTEEVVPSDTTSGNKTVVAVAAAMPQETGNAAPGEGTGKPAELTANWRTIPGYRGESAILDTLRVVMFQAENNDDPWYFRLSVFNSDFSKQCDDRKIYPFGEDAEPIRYGFWAAAEKEDTEAAKDAEAEENVAVSATTVESDAEVSTPPAPRHRLLVLLPGIGGNYFGMTTTALAELAYRNGYAVAALDSTFSWQFYTASGRLPGFIPGDAEMIRQVLRSVKADVIEETGISDWDISLLGYSLGGMHTLKIAELEEMENTLGISRFVAINPPVELGNALEIADALTAGSAAWNQEQAVEKLTDAAGKAFLAMARQYPPYDPEAEEDASAAFDYRAPITAEQADYLAALYFRMPLRSLLFSAHRNRTLEYLKTPYRWGNRNQLYLEIDQISYKEYAEKILAPTEYPELELAELYRLSGLRSMEESLRRNPNVRILHNYDDLLLTEDDRVFLDRTLGSRLTWFDHGGHLGNLYVTTVQQEILEAIRVP